MNMYKYLVVWMCILSVDLSGRLVWTEEYTDICCDNEIYTKAFNRLEQVRNNKKSQLLDIAESIRCQVDRVSKDKVIREFFLIKNEYYQLQRTDDPHEKAKVAIEKYKKCILQHFADNYIQFYDLMMIDKEGDVFFTIKKESEYHKNIFLGELADSSLALHLNPDSTEGYVDFEYYNPSDEPAAFFFQAVYENKEFMGWIVLQWAVNKLNSLVSDYESLGKTGEIFIVNKDQFLLTDIRFIGDSKILTRHLQPKNIELKFRERKGKVIIIDYRGFRALSSFEVIPFMGSEWLLITKIDENEILTDYYKQNMKRLQNVLFDEAIWKENSDTGIVAFKEMKKVDMDEYVRVEADKLIQTKGVSTCTVIVACYPGRFAYMAHVSPYDRLYGGESTDLLGKIIRHIKGYDIYNYEMRAIQFHVVANHKKTIDRIVETLIDEGFFLSQIDYLYNPKAGVEDVIFDCKMNKSIVFWMNRPERNLIGKQVSSFKTNLGDLFKQAVLENAQ